MTLKEKRAAWRAWYAKNRKKMAAYYKKRYQTRRETETAKEKKARLKKQRDYYRAYSKKNRAKINKQRRDKRKAGR